MFLDFRKVNPVSIFSRLFLKWGNPPSVFPLAPYIIAWAPATCNTSCTYATPLACMHPLNNTGQHRRVGMSASCAPGVCYCNTPCTHACRPCIHAPTPQALMPIHCAPRHATGKHHCTCCNATCTPHQPGTLALHYRLL